MTYQSGREAGLVSHASGEAERGQARGGQPRVIEPSCDSPRMFFCIGYLCRKFDIIVAEKKRGVVWT